jgi:hypothetical protein
VTSDGILAFMDSDTKIAVGLDGFDNKNEKKFT